MLPLSEEELLLPLDNTISPPLPPAADPLEMDIFPDAPLVLTPVRNRRLPLIPLVPALLDLKTTSPEDF
jgi:hypothetical protein